MQPVLLCSGSPSSSGAAGVTPSTALVVASLSGSSYVHRLLLQTKPFSCYFNTSVSFSGEVLEMAQGFNPGAIEAGQQRYSKERP